MIELDGVSAWYGDVMALNDVTVAIDEPLIGLLGPNGAGKSTLLAILAGLRQPDTGQARIEGQAPYDNPQVLGQLGLVPEPLAPPGWMTGRRFVTGLARMSGLDRSEASERAEHWLDRLGLADALDRPIRAYSQGMRQRAKLAQAMVHHPRLLLLDEPFTGLDPPGRRQMTEAIKRIADQGTQVVFSSHVLAEVEAVTRDVVMLLKGRLAAHGTVREVRAQLTDVPLRVGIRTPEPREVARAILGIEGLDGLELDEGLVVAEVRDGTTFFRDLTRLGAQLPITSFAPLDEDLESVYGLLAHGGTQR